MKATGLQFFFKGFAEFMADVCCLVGSRRRMPNDGEDPQERQAEEGNHGEADSTPSADEPEFDAATISFEEINFTQMLEASGPKISDPVLAKEWLLHFGPLHPDTNVAIALAGETKVSED